MYNTETIPILSVCQLNLLCRDLLETSFPKIWVEGEISNFSAPASGHFYFSLKEAKAQVRCAMFRLHNCHLKAQPENGMHVKVLAKVSLYPNRGDFQLIVEKLEAESEGLLKKAYDALIKALAKQGLFQQKHKKALPRLPSHIGLITSPTSAAIRDILSILKRRFPYATVTLYPTLVQGEQAAPNIIQALELAQRHNQAEVLLLARGGGSLEDLWAFNDPKLAQAIFDCRIPIVSGVGHESDNTICDFVADLRAPTPSAAAELITQEAVEYHNKVTKHTKNLIHRMESFLQNLSQQLDLLRLRLKHPKAYLDTLQTKRFHLEEKLHFLITDKLQQTRFRFEKFVQLLNTLSPLATLTRGYAIATTCENKVLFSSKNIGIGQEVCIQLSDGLLKTKVTEKK